MIKIEHVSGSLMGQSARFEKTVLRVGRAEECEIRFEKSRESKVSSHHAELLLEEGSWFVIDTGSTNGTLVNGRRVTKALLHPGDEVQLGGGGPTLKIEFDTPAAVADSAGAGRTEVFGSTQMAFVREQVAKSAPRLPAASKPLPAPAVPARTQPSKPPNFANTQQMQVMSDSLKAQADTATASLAELAAKKVQMERAKAGGQSSGQTMMIMVDTLKKVQNSTKAKTKSRWVRVVAIVGGAAAVVVAVLGVVILLQQRQLNGLIKEKARIDKQIAEVQKQIDEEEDEGKLEQLEQHLSQLTGSAQQTLAQAASTDQATAQKLADSGDELDHEIRRILKNFDAETYAVPPLFKERLRYHIDDLQHSSNKKFIYHRKQRYWPDILKEFQALGLPEEMAYIAWAETQFDPKARSAAGAVGMWQLTATTARSLGLKVEGSIDERTDPGKSSKAAAKYLAGLLAEFGSESFMLVLASYNKGENGIRRVLRELALAGGGGFRKEKRDFWHLYRLKKLPEETREYVPKVLAAAIVCANPSRYGLEAAKVEEPGKEEAP